MRQLIIDGDVVSAIIRSKVVDAPTVKTNIVEIEGANGSLDLSTVLTDGNPVYQNRELVFEMALIGADFFDAQSTWNNAYHGKLVTITTDDQAEMYFTGRCYLSDWSEERGFVGFKLTVDADPFMYDVTETVVNVTASSGAGTPVTLANGRKWLAPTITPSATLTVKVGAVSYQLQAGTQIVPDIILRDGNTTLYIIGAGTCQFKYRKGWL